MAKFLKKTYLAIAAFLAVLTVYYLICYRNHIVPQREKYGFEILQPIEVMESDTQSGNTGLRQTIRVRVDHIQGGYCTLIFSSIHQNVTVYDEYNSIYSMKAARKNTFLKTPGVVWNMIVLDENMSGKDIRIELTSVYPGISYKLPDIYFGEKGAILKETVVPEAFPLFISIVLVVIGVGFVGYVGYNYKNSEVDKNLGMLGIFAAMVGLWKASDLSITKFIFNGLPVFSMIPFIALQLLVVPFVCFWMELHSTREDKIWLLPCWASLGLIYVSIILQVFNSVDFRQMMFLIWGVILFAVGVMVFMVVKDFRRGDWGAKLRRNLLGFAAVSAGVFVDMGSYLLSGGRRTTTFTILCFLVYIVMIGYVILRESSALMAAGEGAEMLENKAYHDKMTGCYNRAAFIVDTDSYAVTPDEYAVAVLDLNNLKKCNDVLGHERGDTYIRDSAKIILSTFGTLGNCYRMGGDEFYCLIPKGGLTACKEQKAEMDKLVAEYNEKSSDIHMGIACGFVKYDKRLDYDLNATAKRADALMYQNKQMMKKNGAS